LSELARGAGIYVSKERPISKKEKSKQTSKEKQKQQTKQENIYKGCMGASSGKVPF
jgi:hypothetical protein